MTKAEFKAFTEGYDSALFKETEVVLEGHGKNYEAAWVRGYERGKEAILFHRKLLSRKSTFDYFNNMYGKKGSMF